MLSRLDILQAIDWNEIHTKNVDRGNFGPNSIDVRLDKCLKVYQPRGRVKITDQPLWELDPKIDNQVASLTIPEEGLVLNPGMLYLGSTIESVCSHVHVPMYDGRSSMGRLGIQSHLTAGFGDIGWGYEWSRDFNELYPDEEYDCLKHRSVEVNFDGVKYFIKPTYPTWTLEISVIHPVRVYAGERIGQVFFHNVKSKLSPEHWYSGKYSNQREPQSSKSYEDKEWK